jgi:hypothetical protein
MSNDPLTTLLPAMEIAAFQRRPDGTFVLLAPHPAWFQRLIGDGMFPFLGHILEEAQQFWASGAQGRRDWGPCAEEDEAGRQFHYKVTALAAGDAQYVLFQLDPESDRTREMLQKVRANALAAEYQTSAERSTLLAVQREVRRATKEIDHLLQQFLSASGGKRGELAEVLSKKCGELADAVDMLAGSARPSESS